MLRLRIRDYGPGPADEMLAGHGIVGMRDRATIAGGTFQCGAADGRRLRRRRRAADRGADGVIRTLVADDQQVVREGFAALLGTQEDMTVVASAADGAEAVRLSAEHDPDVVLMDVRMPVMDGIEATRQIAAATEDGPRILILTTFDLDDYVYDALQAGASGFLLKDVPAETLFEAVRVVAGGRGAPCAGDHAPAHRRVRTPAPAAGATGGAL